jgi:hypothetical protein
MIGPSMALIRAVRTSDPAKYLAACVNVLPKDLNVKHESTDAFVNLWRLISDGTAEQAIAKARGESEGTSPTISNSPCGISNGPRVRAASP